jgi:hypothetical protein
MARTRRTDPQDEDQGETRHEGPKRDPGGRFVRRDHSRDAGWDSITGPPIPPDLTDENPLHHAFAKATNAIGEGVEVIVEAVQERLHPPPPTEVEGKGDEGTVLQTASEEETQSQPAISDPPPQPEPVREPARQPERRNTKVPSSEGQDEAAQVIDRLRTRVQQEAGRADDLDFQLFNCLAHIHALDAEIATLKAEAARVASQPDKESADDTSPVRSKSETTRSRTTKSQEGSNIMAPSAAQKRLARKLAPLTGWTEAALLRHSESDLEELLDSYEASATPPSPTTPPPTGGTGGTGVTDPNEAECQFCREMGLHAKMPAAEIMQHQALFHRDKLAALLGMTPATPPNTAPAAATGTTGSPPAGGTASTPVTAATPATPEEEEIEVPRFIGENIDSTKVQGMLFTSQFPRGGDKETADSSKTNGEILFQTPAPGTKFKPSSPPKLTFMVNRLTAEQAAAVTPPSSGQGIQLPSWIKKIVGTPDDLIKGIGS